MTVLLSTVPSNRLATVVSLDNLSALLKNRLLALGVIPGLSVIVRYIAPLGGPIALQTQTKMISISREDAAHILVEPTSRDS